MFVRACWKPFSENEIFDLIDHHSWGLLVSNGEAECGPFATNLAFVLERERRTLISHLARANAHAAALLRDKSPALAIFEGPSQYVTASWYPGRDMPSTVYYTAVHCYGQLCFHDDKQLRAAIEDLTQKYEQDIPGGWQTSDIPEKDIARRLPSILGFELRIDRLEAKFKLGQDEPKRDALAVAERLLASESPSDRILGEMTKRYNENRPS